MKDVGNSSFVCPNDRQLQLRAKLNSGWSFRTCRSPTSSTNSPASTRPISLPATVGSPQPAAPLRDEEIERIKKVLERAQRIDLLEQERVGKLIDRLENMKKHATGNGSSQCVLCADGFGMLGASYVSCVDCHKSVCNKCSIETMFNQQMISLCKICSENRELWKKSGAWFFRSLPLRQNTTTKVKSSSSVLSSVTNRKFLAGDSLSMDDDSSSDDRQNPHDRLRCKTPSTNVSIPSNSFVTVNPFQQILEQKSNSNEQERDESSDSLKTDDQSSKELSIDEYLPKNHPTLSPTPSVTSTTTNNVPFPVPPPPPPPSSLPSLPSTLSIAQARPSSSVVINTSSPVDDCGFGMLEFEIIWRESLNVLTISLLRARNLRSCDSNGLSDPYVKLHLVPGVAKATKLRSHTIRRTLNPDFDETLVYHGISMDDMRNKSLKFSVYDEDSVGSDFLGEYRLKLSTIRADVKEAFAVYLQNKTDLPTDEDKNERGKILLSLCYSKVQRTFHVKIIRGSQLLPMDFGQTSDPYCKLCLFPSDDSNVKWNFKTSVKKSTLHPEFHEEFHFNNVQLHDLISKTLQITVFDKDMGKKDDYIGGFQLGQSASGDELKHWLLMVKSPDQWVEMWHKLKSDTFASNSQQRDSQTSR